ncbi:hypothetical protein E9840_01930 [Tissierella creatinini]|nr:hypothetical protein E9840_01930 [Tissierella creatinini]TJX66533.1 hypothetical protein E8P77_07730 [Soehngenia saccharolytica]
MSACTAANDSDLEEELQAKKEIIATLESENEKLQEEINKLNNRIEELEGETPSQTQATSYLTAALEAVELLSNDDMNGLASMAHPVKGIRFTPYSYIDTSTDQVFTANQISNLMTDTTVYTWGNYDGSGEPINKTFADYYDEFVYDEDYANPHIIGNNTLIGKGNSIDNLTDVYTNGEFVEFHFTGFDAQYEGMDWSSLKLVFEEDSGIWYLVAIIHSQWTI